MYKATEDATKTVDALAPTTDREILRELGKQIAEIAALPVQQETIDLWKAHNRLEPVRPMVMIDQIAWHEMNVDGELDVHCKDPFCQGIEWTLRSKLYRWRHMRADMVIEPFVDIGKVIRGGDFGIRIVERTATGDPSNSVVGHFYTDQLSTDEDIEKIRAPEISLDKEATDRAEERARAIFDGILEVRTQGTCRQFAPWDMIATWRGVENLLIDLMDRPDFTHRLMTKLTAALLSELDQLEEKELLCLPQDTIHCTGAFTDELPADGFDPARVRTKDLWTNGQAQIFSSVSPSMHKEFDLDYAVKWYARFGLVYYGCCEPLHNKIDIIREIPNLRKISMSPWVDVEQGAERIGRDFVFSRKPTPALLAGDIWHPETVEADLIETRDACARHGTPLEFILKDISTVRYKPERLWEWVDIAMKVAKGG